MVSWDQPFLISVTWAEWWRNPHSPKKTGLGWEEKRTAVLQGRPPFLEGVIPEGQVPTGGLSPWWCVPVTREGSRRSFSCFLALIAHFGHLQSRSPFWLQQGLCATGSCSLLAGPSELLGCSQACSAMALGASSCVRVRNGGSLFCFGAAWSSGLHSLAARCSLGLPILQRCWFTAHLTGGPRHQTKSSRWHRVSIKLFEMVEALLKQRLFPLKIWLSWKWTLSFTGMFFQSCQAVRLWILVVVFLFQCDLDRLLWFPQLHQGWELP